MCKKKYATPSLVSFTADQEVALDYLTADFSTETVARREVVYSSSED